MDVIRSGTGRSAYHQAISLTQSEVAGTIYLGKKRDNQQKSGWLA